MPLSWISAFHFLVGEVSLVELHRAWLGAFLPEGDSDSLPLLLFWFWVFFIISFVL